MDEVVVTEPELYSTLDERVKCVRCKVRWHAHKNCRPINLIQPQSLNYFWLYFTRVKGQLQPICTTLEINYRPMLLTHWKSYKSHRNMFLVRWYFFSYFLLPFLLLHNSIPLELRVKTTLPPLFKDEKRRRLQLWAFQILFIHNNRRTCKS